LEELIDLWQVENPSPEQTRDDILAVKASLRDMESGERGRPWDEFAREFRAHHGPAERSPCRAVDEHCGVLGRRAV
jgi:hypothetical protein